MQWLEEKLFRNLFLKLFNTINLEWFSSNWKVFSYTKLDSCQQQQNLIEAHKKEENQLSKKETKKRW